MKPTACVKLPACCLLLCGFFSASSAPAAEYGKVELLRDRWGTPHVFAETDAGAMYGLGYATAEDRGFQMSYTLRIMQGRLAELIGDVKKVRRNETAVQNDRKMRTFGFHRAAKELVGHLDAESVALLQAYSDGVNDYFKLNGDKLHGLYEKVGLVPEPWTPADCILSWWHLAQFFATDGTRDLMRHRHLTEGPPPGRRMPGRQPPGRNPPARGQRPQAGRSDPRRGAADLKAPDLQPSDLKPLPPDESTAVVGREAVTDAWLERADAFLRQHGFDTEDRVEKGQPTPPGPKFSHAWVAGGQKSGTGSAVLISEPRTPVANPSLMYEFHLRGKTFDARGIGVAGSPVILIGWNRNVAWGMTALGADQADLFRLKTDPDHPDQYEFDGRWRPMRVLREQIQVKGGRPQSLVIRLTHFGPVVDEFVFARPNDPPVALKRIPICETGRETIQGAIGMLRAGNVQEFYRSLAGWRFPTANVVFGDRQGSVGFSLVGALALRSPLALADGGAAHDGSAEKYDWQAIVPHDLVPHVIDPRRGYVFSGNHRPVGSFYPIPLGISTGSMGDTLRSWRLRELLTGKPTLTPPQMAAMQSDAVNPARREIVRIGFHLRDVLNRDLSPEAMRALDQLEDWYKKGAAADLGVPGAELAMELNTFFRFISTDLAIVYGGGESGLSYFLKTVGRRLDGNPKAEVQPLEQQFVDNALAGAWNNARGKYGPDPKSWNANARRSVTGRRLGYFESLDGFPSLDPAHDLSYPPLRRIDGGTIASRTAQAYSQWVPLDDVDAARSILPIGPSERPDDPMRTVNTRGWAAGELHPAPLSRAAVEKYAVSTVVLSK